tara:strand:- start:2290 stop:3273 length:984 start_codon:yes stop_codon:yes gene_type:complete
MKIDKQKEKEFMDSKFNFSYSSMNRLLFSPRIFYKEYILKEKEVKMDKHLVEGRVIHTLLLQPDDFDNMFTVLPSKVPSDAVRRVLNELKQYPKNNLNDLDSEIITALQNQNLYQSFKDDNKRLAKIQTSENEEYFKFLLESNKDIIDQDTLERCKNRVEMLKDNANIMSLFTHEVTDFEMDSLEVYNEKKLDCKLTKYNFGLKGIVDRYVIDHETKTITIIDLKTSGKSLMDFPETVDFYKYWLQAAIYVILVGKNVDEKVAQTYNISFKFVVIDKYDQTYAFDVSNNTLNQWTDNLHKLLEIVNFHYTKCRYDLPYEFITRSVTL